MDGYEPQGASTDRRFFLGGSDARVIMGNDENALVRLWQEKRGEIEAENLSGNLIVQLGRVTEDLNRRWFERSSGQTVTDVQARIQHRHLPWMMATLDGRIESTGTLFEAKFMLPWSFSPETAVEKHTPQLQHNMHVIDSRLAVLSIITGGGNWVEIAVPADPIYQHVMLAAEEEFWQCVQSGKPPRLVHADAPRPRMAAVRVVDMTTSNAWAELAGIFRRTHAAHFQHERAKSELKALVPEDAKEAIGHGIRAKRSKAGAVSFDILEVGGEHAAV